MTSAKLSRTDLHEYQNVAVQKLIENPFYALFLEMGLGKSVSTLTAISDLYDNFAISKVLIVAPLRVAINSWPTEIKLWKHTQDLTFCQLAGLTPAKRTKALGSNALIFIINQELIPWLVDLYGQKWPFDMLVIDESNSVKNHASKRFKALKKVRGKIDRIVELTGTPAPNGLIDIWAPIWMLDMGERLGKTITKYRQSYFDQDYMGWGYEIREGSADKIHEKVKDITLSMRALDYIKMPEVIYNDIKVVLSDRCMEQYTEFKREMIVALDNADSELTALSAAAVSTKCQQLAQGCCYTEENPEGVWFHDEKLDALEEVISEAESSPVLVAYTFISDRERILKRFKKAKLLDKDPKTITKWNAGKIPILIAHPLSASMGLNLQSGGHILVWFGQTWSSTEYMQFNARLHRQGQKEKTVFIHHIIAANTIDEKVLRVVAGKITVQEALLEATRQ